MKEERRSFADKELEAMLHSLKRKDPNIICPHSGKKIVKVCTEPKCKIALRCSDVRCKVCGREAHMAHSFQLLDKIT